MIIGTAGHIDHGKTTLVKALTGVDADRLPEEKARGITLDLGYAYTPLAGDTGASAGGVLGFVDVPGHEKLIHNMLAGATGIDFALLVVAADDGPMPQTREHLELLELLGLHRGAVALTKIDAVAPERRAEAAREVATVLEHTALAAAPLFAVSAVTGEGVADLRAYLDAQARALPGRDAAGGFRLAVDRVFTLVGIGTVVTGTAHSGRVRVGDALTLAPADRPVRVRSLRAQDRPANEACAGQRIALGLVGVDKQDVRRGDWLVASSLAKPLRRFQGEVVVPAGGTALSHWTPVHVHLGTADLIGRVALLEGERLAPGGGMLAEIVLDRDTIAVRGDRFILRDTSASRTLAGGRVLDTQPPTRHKRAPERLAILRAMTDDDPAVALRLMLGRQPAGVDLAAFAGNWNLETAERDALATRAGLTVIDAGAAPIAFSAGGWRALGERLLAALDAEQRRAPDLPGVERDRLRRLTLPTLARAAFDRVLDEQLAADAVRHRGPWLHLPGHCVELSPADQRLWQSLRPWLDAAPLGPPRVRDVARASGVAEDAVRRLFQRVARVGELYPVAHDHYFSAAAVADLARIVAALCAAAGAARAAELRDRIGGGRKVAIHILEFFDRVGYTRRVRDQHVLRQAGGTSPWSRAA